MRRTSLGLLLFFAACGGGGSSTVDGSVPLADADPNAPDADPNSPDAMEGTPDATPPPNCSPVQGTPTLAAQKIGGGIDSPVDIKSPRNDSRIFVVSQLGQIRIIKGDNNVLDTPFLDVSDLISNGSERGLLGLAFHPNYATNGRFFIYYTRSDGSVVLAEGTVSSNADVANATTTPLLTITHTQYPNHNGGWIDFGPDKRLYMGIGDGGSGGDPNLHGQDTTDLLAKILRLDVDTPGMAKPAPNNPFINDGNDNKKKVWAYGVRNPWRNSFDRKTGDLYIGDVGQDFVEEIDVQPSNSTGGLNYGWSIMEGTTCFNRNNVKFPLPDCDKAGKVLPIYEYPHNGAGASVTGGYVYRGCKMPALEGTYFFADEAFKAFFSLKWDGANAQTGFKKYDQLAQYRVTTFGQDIDGEILFADYGTDSIFRLVPAP
jgi:glucose/arabinose dehydrogenase